MSNKLNMKLRDKYLLRVDVMTLIMGARCKDGIVLASDRRVLRGTEYSEEKKIRLALQNFYVGGSGVIGLVDKFILEMNLYLQSVGSVSWIDFLKKLEDIVFSLNERYTPRLKEQYQLDLLCMFKDTDKSAHLHRIYGNGYGQEINTFDIIGHGGLLALPFIKPFNVTQLTMSQMNKLSTYVLELIDKHRVDVTVGGKPQILNAPFDSPIVELSDEDISKLIVEVSPTEQKLAKILDLS